MRLEKKVRLKNNQSQTMSQQKMLRETKLKLGMLILNSQKKTRLKQKHSLRLKQKHSLRQKIRKKTLVKQPQLNQQQMNNKATVQNQLIMNQQQKKVQAS
jgi:hypothetical protein